MTRVAGVLLYVYCIYTYGGVYVFKMTFEFIIVVKFLINYWLIEDYLQRQFDSLMFCPLRTNNINIREKNEKPCESTENIIHHQLPN